MLGRHDIREVTCGLFVCFNLFSIVTKPTETTIGLMNRSVADLTPRLIASHRVLVSNPSEGKRYWEAGAAVGQWASIIVIRWDENLDIFDR